MPRTRDRRGTGAMGGQKRVAIRHFLDTARGASAERGMGHQEWVPTRTPGVTRGTSVSEEIQAEVEKLSGVFGRSIQLALVLSGIPGTWKKILVCLNASAYLVKC